MDHKLNIKKSPTADIKINESFNSQICVKKENIHDELLDSQLNLDKHSMDIAIKEEFFSSHEFLDIADGLSYNNLKQEQQECVKSDANFIFLQENNDGLSKSVSEQSTSQDSGSSTNGKMATRICSDIWYHFSRPSGLEKKAVCNYCKASISFEGGSTGNLKRHLKAKHVTVPLSRNKRNGSRSPPTAKTTEIKNMNIEVEQPSFIHFFQQEGVTRSVNSEQKLISFLSSSLFSRNGQNTENGSILATESAKTISLTPVVHHTSRDSRQLSMSLFLESMNDIPPNKTKALDIQLTKMLCKEFLPFSFVESDEFVKFIKMAIPGYKLPCRKTISQTLIPSLYVKIKDELKIKLTESTAICITCECWTAITNNSFYAVTACYFDQAMKLNSTLVECSEFVEQQSATSLAEWLDSVFKNWNIKQKIVAAVTDNTANMKEAIKLLSIRHIPCYAHSLNLIVQNAIKNSINGIVNKVRAVVQYFKRSSSALAKLHEMQTTMKKPSLKLKQDVPNRWNSTFDMLDRVIKNKEPIIYTLAQIQAKDLSSLEAWEWEIAEHAVKLLEVFEEATSEISADKNVSLSKSGVLSVSLVNNTNEYLQETREITLPNEITTLGNELMEGLAKTFGDRETLELISKAIFLDPRFKKNGFENEERYNYTYSALAEKLQRMNSSVPPQHTYCNNTHSESQKKSSLWQKFELRIMQLNTSSSSTASAIVELDNYVAEQVINRTSDSPTWWHERRSLYPNLFEVSKLYLCIPASSVPCERIFSKAGQILSVRRSRLITSKLSQMIFLTSNLK